MSKKLALVSLAMSVGLVTVGCSSEDDNPEVIDETEEVKEVEETAEKEKVEEVDKEDDVSQEYKNALSKAQSYAEMQHMSKAGVYNQLTSEYGENFPEEAADYAIENLDADWKANALEKGKSYYEDQSMSKDGVYDQLVSEYGEEFTEEEAQYAVDNLD